MHILYNTRSFLVNFSKSITKDRSCVRQQKLGAGMLPHRKQSISLSPSSKKKCAKEREYIYKIVIVIIITG
jgi:hypothetical protein